MSALRGLQAGEDTSAKRWATRYSAPWLVALLLFWLQPLGLAWGYPPVGTYAFLLLGMTGIMGRLITRTPVPVPFVALIAIGGMAWTIVGAYIGSVPARRSLDWASIAVTVLVAYTLLSSRRGRRTVLLAATLGLAIWVTAVLVQVTASPTLFGLTAGYGSDRVTGLHYNPNGAGMFLMMGTAILAGVAPKRLSLLIAQVALVVLGTFCVSATGSRGALAGVIVACAATVIFRSRRQTWSAESWLLRGIGAALLGLALIRVLPWAAELLLGRPIDVGEVSSDRSEVWQRGWLELMEHPWFGVSEVSLGAEVANAHNSFLEAALRYGVPGAFLFLLIIIGMGGRALRNLAVQETRTSVMPGLALLLAMLTYGVSHVAMLDNTFFWAAATSLMLKRTQKLETVSER